MEKQLEENNEIKKRSSSKDKEKKSSAVERVNLRNRFFYVYSRKISFLFFLLLVSIGINGYNLFYLYNYKTPPVYFHADKQYRLIPSVPLNKSIGSISTVQEFAFEALKASYTFDYINYKGQLQSASEFYTTKGWEDYLNSYKESNNIETLKTQNTIVYVVPTGPLEVTKEDLEIDKYTGKEVYTWTVKAPISVKYRMHNAKGVNELDITGTAFMKIIRVNYSANPKGIAVNQLALITGEKK